MVLDLEERKVIISALKVAKYALLMDVKLIEDLETKVLDYWHEIVYSNTERTPIENHAKFQAIREEIENGFDTFAGAGFDTTETVDNLIRELEGNDD